jgi:nicotinamide riboside kinase
MAQCLKIERLNFAHCLAEEPSMKRVDSFFSLIIFIVGSLGCTFYYAHNSLDYFENNPSLKAKYERTVKLKALNKELKDLNKTPKSISRQVASIDSAKENSEVVTALDSQAAAKKYYSKIRSVCFEPSKEMECLTHIDLVVSQFPETVWAAESLIILVEIYHQNSRDKQAQDVLHILKEEFKKFPSVQAKVNYLEGQIL